MLERDSARRPSAADVLVLLDRAADATEVHRVRQAPAVAHLPDGPAAKPAADTSLERTVSRRRPVLLLLAAAATVVALGVAAAVIALSGGDSEPERSAARSEGALTAPSTSGVVDSRTVTTPSPTVSTVTRTAAASTAPVTGTLASEPSGAIVIYSSVRRPLTIRWAKLVPPR